MAIPTFPTLPGLSFPVKRSPAFQTIEHKAVDGVSTTQSPQPFAIYRYELPFEFLRAADAYLEIQQLLSFYTARRGKGLPFHFNDPDDNSATGQVLGVGDGVTTDFGFVRTMVNNVDPIQDVSQILPLLVYVNGVLKAGGVDYTGLLTTQYQTLYGIRFLTGAPAVGAVVTADFFYSWLCRFNEDEQEFSKLQYVNGKGLWESKAIKFSTVLQ